MVDDEELNEYGDEIVCTSGDHGIDVASQRVDLLSESGFMGIRKDGDLVEAVTASGLTEVPLDPENVRSAIEPAELVVADCNLSGEQLRFVGTIADENDVSLFVSGVSESKAERVEALDTPVELFSLSRREATHLLGRDPLQADLTSVREWMEAQSVRKIVVTADDVCGVLWRFRSYTFAPGRR